MATEGVVTETIVVPVADEQEAEKEAQSHTSAPPKTDGTTKKRIRYRIEYVENTTGNVLHRQETKGLNLDDEAGADGETVFELVTTIRTGQKNADDKSAFQAIRGGSTANVSMHVLSNSIIHALRSVVQYYPGQDLSSDPLKIDSPYAILVHHYDELMEYREKVKPDVSKELCYRDRNAYEHIGVLKSFLDEHIMPAVEAERARNKRGAFTFDMYWVLMKPGAAYRSSWKEDDEEYVGIVHSLTGGSFTKPSQPWREFYWTLKYDGKFADRVINYSILDKFDGENDLASTILDLNNLAGDTAVEDLISYGKLYWRHLRKQCKYYKGKTSSYPYNEVEGLVMVDMDAYFEAFPDARPATISSSADSRIWVSDCPCPVCTNRRDAASGRKTTPFERFVELPPKTRNELQDDQYLLLPSHVYAYVFRTRTWGMNCLDYLDTFY